jgi:hypothetical protein
MVAFGEQLISSAPVTSFGAGQAGRWGGALNTTFSTATGVRLRNGQTSVEGGFLTSNFEDGQYITFGKAAGVVPSPHAIFRISRNLTNGLLHIDRPWPGVDGSDYEILDRYAVQRLGDPYQVGANSAQVFEGHQDRLFAARFHPRFIEGTNGAPDTPHKFEDDLSTVIWSASWLENGSGDGVTFTAPTTQDEDLCCFGENLWYPNAYLTVAPGHGGGITGMHSLGNMLLIIKEDACYALRGAVSSKGYPSGASLDLVNAESGTPSLRGSAKTEIGVAWANSRGLWIFDGNQAQNLVDGSIKTMWNQIITDFSDVVVSGVNNRIIIQSPEDNAAWVYYIDRKQFVRQTCHPHTNIIPFGDANFGDVELAVDDTSGNVIDWSYDHTEINDTDSENNSFPRLRLRTQPMPADEQPFYTARPNTLLVSGEFSGPMEATIYLGRGGYLEDQEPDDQISPDNTQPLEYGVQARDYDDTHRIPIGGISSRPAHRFMLSQTNIASRMRVYGIGVEYSEDYTVDND